MLLFPNEVLRKAGVDDRETRRSICTGFGNEESWPVVGPDGAILSVGRGGGSVVLAVVMVAGGPRRTAGRL